MRASFWAKLTKMKVSELTPSRSGEAFISGACRMVKPGRNAARSASAGRMNMLRAKSVCQALSLMNRTGSR